MSPSHCAPGLLKTFYDLERTCQISACLEVFSKRLPVFLFVCLFSPSSETVFNCELLCVHLYLTSFMLTIVMPGFSKMGWGHNGTGTQWDGGTMGRGHNGTGTQWDGDTVGRGHNGTGTGTQWDGGTMGRGHSGTGAQWDRGTMGRGHNGTGTQWDGGIMGRGHNGTGTQWDGDTMGRGHNGTGAQWDGGTTRTAPISNPARPQVADSGTAPRYRSQVNTLTGQLAITVEGEVGQARGAAVLFEIPLQSSEGAVRRFEAPY